MRQLGEDEDAVGALLPFFSKAKHFFFPNMQPIRVGGQVHRGRTLWWGWEPISSSREHFHAAQKQA